MTKELKKEVGWDYYYGLVRKMKNTTRFREGVKECITSTYGKRKWMVTEFGVAILLRATVEELEEMPGLGPVKAVELYEMLHQLQQKGAI